MLELQLILTVSIKVKDSSSLNEGSNNSKTIYSRQYKNNFLQTVFLV